MVKNRKWPLIAVLLVLVLVAAACGRGDSGRSVAAQGMKSRRARELKLRGERSIPIKEGDTKAVKARRTEEFFGRHPVLFPAGTGKDSRGHLHDQCPACRSIPIHPCRFR